MKNLLILTIFIFSFGFSLNAQPSSDYKLIINDEFDDGNADWIVENCTQGSSDCDEMFYMSDNVQESNGKLIINGKEEPTTCGNETREFSSGKVILPTTLLYGYYEIKAKVPKGNGYHPSFWFVGTAGCSPDMYREIDIFEFCGCNCKEFQAGLHYESDGDGISGNNIKHDSKDIELSDDACSTFNIYGVEWTPTDIKFYLNGQLKYTKANTHLNKSMLMILQSVIGSCFGCEKSDETCQIDENTEFPETFEIMYFKGWKKQNTAVSIVGPNSVCINEVNTYYAPEYPGATYTWTGTNGVQINTIPYLEWNCSIAGAVSRQINLTALSSGIHALTLTISFPGGYVETKSINIQVETSIPNPPTYIQLIIPNQQECCYYLSLPYNVPNVTYYRWNVTHLNGGIGSEEFITYPSGNSSPILYHCFSDRYLIVKVAAGNSCGESNFYYQFIIRPPISGCTGFILVSPNPAGSEIEIELLNDNDEIISDFIGEILIIDNFFQVVHSGAFLNGSKMLDTDSFQSGIYQVFVSKENISLQTSFIKN